MTRPPDPELLPRLFFELFIIATVEIIVFKKRYNQCVFKIVSVSLIANLILFDKCGLREISFHYQQSLNRKVKKNKKKKKVDGYEEDVKIEYNVKT